MGTTTLEIRKLSDGDQMAATEELLKDIGDVGDNQLTELQKLNETMRKMGSAGVLT